MRAACSLLPGIGVACACLISEGLTDVSEDKDGSSCMRLTSVTVGSVVNVERLSLVVVKPGVLIHPLTISAVGNIAERWVTRIRTEETAAAPWMSTTHLPALIDMTLSREVDTFFLQFELIVNATMLNVPDGTTLNGTLSLLPSATNGASSVVIPWEVTVEALASCQHSRFEVHIAAATILDEQGRIVIRHDSKNVNVTVLLRDVDGLIVDATMASIRYRLVWRPNDEKEVVITGDLLEGGRASAVRCNGKPDCKAAVGAVIPLDLLRPGARGRSAVYCAFCAACGRPRPCCCPDSNWFFSST